MNFDDLIKRDAIVGHDDRGRPLFAGKAKRIVAYQSRKHAGRGTVVYGYIGETGPWVMVHDKERKVDVTVRPNQITR